MDSRFDEIAARPENSIFQIVFFPDRVYHARYLNATRSERYRYDVQEVRSATGVLAMKGQVFLDGVPFTNFLRLEYRSERLNELAREKGRFVGDDVRAWVRLHPKDEALGAEATVKMHYCPWVDAYQVEIWGALDPEGSVRHDFKVLDMMGKDGSITRVQSFAPALRDVKALRRIELAFRENDEDEPCGYAIGDADAQWDNNLGRTHQEPIDGTPSSQRNTVPDRNYLLDFRRGYFLDTREIEPVRYRNAMMDGDNPDRDDRPEWNRPNQNVIDMRWIVQRELGSSVVFFHEVTIPPHTVEGTHWHIGTEELYYIVEGEGIAYLGDEDDPALADRPTVRRKVFGLDWHDCKQVAVRPGHVIFTKSGGIHGIRNESDGPLRFVAFLYHSS
ncbi:MAG: hypothetical protein ACJ79H_08745 [Myxococcales bacterium]